MTPEYSRLAPNDTLIVKFTRPMPSNEVRDWLERFRRAYPERRAIFVSSDMEVRIEPRATRITHRLLALAVLVLVIDIGLRMLL